MRCLTALLSFVLVSHAKEPEAFINLQSRLNHAVKDHEQAMKKSKSMFDFIFSSGAQEQQKKGQQKVLADLNLCYNRGLLFEDSNRLWALSVAAQLKIPYQIPYNISPTGLMIPGDIWREIFSHMDFKEIERLFLSSKASRSVLSPHVKFMMISLTTPDHAKSIFKALELLPSLQTFYLKGKVTYYKLLESTPALHMPALQELRVTDWPKIRFTNMLPDLKKLSYTCRSFFPIETFQHCTGLQELEITGAEPALNNFILHEHVAGWLSQLSQLTKLKLAKTNIRKIDFIRSLTKLQSLDISDTYVDDFQPLEYCQALTDLDLSACCDTKYDRNNNFMRDFPSLTNLISLKLRGKEFSSKYLQFKFREKLPVLENLDLRASKIERGDLLVFPLTLRKLDVRDCFIIDKTLELSYITDLVSLSVDRVNLKQLPYLPQLTHLSVGHIPFSKNYLDSRKYIYSGRYFYTYESFNPTDLLFYNNLISLSVGMEYGFIAPYLSHMTRLTSLVLHNGRLDENDISFLTCLTNLNYLKLSYTNQDEIQIKEKYPSLKNVKMSTRVLLKRGVLL